MTPELSSQQSTRRPAERWRQLVGDSTPPQAVLDAAPEPEGSLEPERFRWRPEEDAKQPSRPSRRRALEALPEGGSVLDVGVGGGASSLGLVPKPGLIIGVDTLVGMLESFEASARGVGVRPGRCWGHGLESPTRWSLPTWRCVTTLSTHVTEIEDFVAALTARARHRVVLELSAHSPLAGSAPLWMTFHGIERPDSLVADEAQAVLVSMGLAVEREDIILAPRDQPVTLESVAFARRRLFVGAERDPEIEEFLRGRVLQEQRVVALWWPGAAER